MAIADLQAKQGKVDLTADIVAKEEPRTFNKFGKEGKVCNATLQDDSGSIKLTLWNDQVDQVNIGDKIKITNGYVSEWQGEKQLSTGKFGTLEVIGNGTQEPLPELPKEEIAEAPAKKNDDDSDDDIEVSEEDL